MRRPRVLAIVLAGGKGSRMGALTEHRAKPALPVGGTCRLIDVSLSNLAHSHLSDVWLVQQYLPESLNRYLNNGRPWDLDRTHGGLRVLPPFQGADGEGFAEGNSDSLYRQLDSIRRYDPEHVLVLSADHLYTIDFQQVLDTHLEGQADLTLVTTRAPEEASRFTVVQADDHGAVRRIDYKPEQPEGDLVACEMFLFRAQTLIEGLEAVKAQFGELGDYGHDLLPWCVEHGRVLEHRHTGYWRDIGTVQAYWAAHMDLLDGTGAPLADPDWPIWSAEPVALPAWVHPEGDADDSLLSPGAQIHGRVSHSVIGPGVVVEEGAEVVDSVLLDSVRVGPGVRLERVVADMGAEITGGNRRGTAESVTVIGADGLVRDAERIDPEQATPREG